MNTSWFAAAQRWLQAGERYRAETSSALVGFQCVYCGGTAETVDHLIPRAAGGSDDVGNLVPACRSCNGSKGARSLATWIQWMRVVQARLAGAERIYATVEQTDEFDDPEFLARWDHTEERQSA